MNRWFAVILLLSACSAAPDRTDDPLRNDGVWNSANAQMERHFEQTALPPTLDVPIEAFEHVLKQKVAQHKEVRQAFEGMYAANDLTVRSAATLRVGQIELNFACELALLDAPADFGANERAILREMISERTTPFFASARRYIGQASRMGSGPYATAAKDLRDRFPKLDGPGDSREYCERTRAAWSREPSRSFDARMVSSCEAGNASACYVASLLVKNDRLAADYAERACSTGLVEACVGPDDETSCNDGSRKACWAKAAIVRPQDFDDYTRYCSAGSGYDCFRRGLLLERGTDLLDQCARQPVAPATSIDDARKACTDGEVEACFTLGVATYTVPRELEKLERKQKRESPSKSESSQDRAETMKSCIEDGDRAACASSARAFLSLDSATASQACAARFLFEACRPDSTEWCYLFDRFEND